MTNFHFDDSSEGGNSVGPWVSWKYKGTEDRSVNLRSFAIRGKDDDGETYTRQFDTFARGVVLDLESVQQGFIKDGVRGTPPVRTWGVTQRPDDSRKPSGSFAWSKAFSIRIAISPTETATWEDASWGGYEGFRRLASQIKAANPAPGTSPVVVFSGQVEEIDAKNGKLGVPLFTIAKWIPRPKLFASDAMAGFTDAPTAAAPAPDPKPARISVPTAAVDDFGSAADWG